MVPLEKGMASCYETSLVCVIAEDHVDQYFDERLGYTAIPKILLRGFRDGFRQHLDHTPKVKKDGFLTLRNQRYPEPAGRIWYLDILKE